MLDSQIRTARGEKVLAMTITQKDAVLILTLKSQILHNNTFILRLFGSEDDCTV